MKLVLIATYLYILKEFLYNVWISVKKVAEKSV